MDAQTAVDTRTTLQALTDRQLVSVLSTLSVLERRAIAKLVAAIAEFDQRKLYLPLGFTSLFAYCTNRLGLSQDETFHRIAAARIVRKYPVALRYLERNALSLTTLGVLGAHLTPENHVRLLDAASHQKKPEVEMLIARLKPRPDVPSTIRKLPPIAGARGSAAVGSVAADSAPAGSAAAGSAAAGSAGAGSAAAGSAQEGSKAEGSAAADSATGSAAEGSAAADSVAEVSVAEAPRGELSPSGATVACSPVNESSSFDVVAPAQSHTPSATVAATTSALDMPSPTAVRGIASRRPIVEPLSEASYRLQITITKATHDQLREIQSLMRHVDANGDPALIVARAIQLLLDSLKKRRAGIGSARPPVESDWRNTPAPSGRYLPIHVRRAVWTRDRASCAFLAEDGTRCGSPDFLEFHHVMPYVRGGKATVRNIQLRCRAHNAHESELDFGRQVAVRRRQRRR